MAECSFLNVPLDWENTESWRAAVLHGKSLKASLGRLCLGDTVHHLWRQQNDLQHCNTPRKEESILAQINWDVWARSWLRANSRALRRTWSMYIDGTYTHCCSNFVLVHAAARVLCIMKSLRC
jgi:hypothetical protein